MNKYNPYSQRMRKKLIQSFSEINKIIDLK